MYLLHNDPINVIYKLAIVYKHWPGTREFITRTNELWNTWIRWSCYCNRV